MFQLLSLMLEKWVIKDTIALWSHLEELWNQEYSIAVGIFANALVVLTKKLHDSVKEIGSNLGDGNLAIHDFIRLAPSCFIARLISTCFFLLSLFDKMLKFLSDLTWQMPFQSKLFLLSELRGIWTSACAVKSSSYTLVRYHLLILAIYKVKHCILVTCRQIDK